MNNNNRIVVHLSGAFYGNGKKLDLYEDSLSVVMSGSWCTLNLNLNNAHGNEALLPCNSELRTMGPCALIRKLPLTEQFLYGL